MENQITKDVEYVKKIPELKRNVNEQRELIDELSARNKKMMLVIASLVLVIIFLSIWIIRG